MTTLGRQAVAGFVILGLVALVCWFVLIKPGQDRRRAAEAEAGAAVAGGTAKAAQDAQGVVIGNAARERATDDQTRANRDEILKAPDAGVSAGAAGDAGLRGLCKRPSLRDSGRCRELLGVDP